MSAHAFDLSRPLIVDSFAGGGGASTGIEMALGRSPDIAINHNAAALAMHAANHPAALHLSKNIWQVDPLDAVRGRPVGLAWFSPDCKHFSKAKGGKPVKRNVRDLAWTVVLWAKRARPAVIILENVEEFQDWGPLLDAGEGRFVPCPDRRGETFTEWVRQLRRLGYKVEWRELVAADYGAPTTRKRFFLIARRDGLPIRWPAPTHGRPSDTDVVAGRKLPWRTAAEIIDWSLPCPSIFETAEEIMAKHGVRAVRPLAEATMARVARGTKRYVLDAAKPFIVKFRRGATGHAIDEPLCTVTANSYEVRPGGAAPIGLAVPSLVKNMTNNEPHSPEEPLTTILTGGHHMMIAPSVVSLAHGDSGGRREYPATDPIGTVHAGGQKFGVIAPHLVPITHRGDVRTYSVEEPARTITTANGGEVALVAPTLIQTGYGERDGQAPRALDIEPPLGTVVAGGVKHAVVAAFLAQHNGDRKPDGAEYVRAGRPADAPASTITSTGHQQSVVATHLTHLYTSNTAGGRGGLEEPIKTVTAGGGHAALVAAFMTKYYGTGGQDQNVADPLHTATERARMALVTVAIDGDEYVIDDIGIRMHTPRELFSAQGFPADYRIDGIAIDGRTLTKAEQISCCGNSVCPPLAAALVAANCGHLAVERTLEAAE